jgi:alkylation response protein AidB-like acyl-CoA dehydrogenase
MSRPATRCAFTARAWSTSTRVGADDTAIQEAGLLLDLLTPIAKSWPSQWCLEANSLAIQIHGGYGYTREYPVEQFYRDNRLNPIHEGTHGIQALDLLGRKADDERRRGDEAVRPRSRQDRRRGGRRVSRAGSLRRRTAAPP